MQTIGFFSFGETTMRCKSTILMESVGHLLMNGKRIFLVDANLPAPVLHVYIDLYYDGYQRIEGEDKLTGLLQWIRVFQTKGQTADNFAKYLSRSKDGKLTMMLSGAETLSWDDYAIRFLGIDYRYLLPVEGQSDGIGLFMNLCDRINKEYAPDYLLIDTVPMLSDISLMFALSLNKAVWIPSFMPDNLRAEFYMNRMKEKYQNLNCFMMQPPSASAENEKICWRELYDFLLKPM